MPEYDIFWIIDIATSWLQLMVLFFIGWHLKIHNIREMKKTLKEIRNFAESKEDNKQPAGSQQITYDNKPLDVNEALVAGQYADELRKRDEKAQKDAYKHQEDLE